MSQADRWLSQISIIQLTQLEAHLHQYKTAELHRLFREILPNLLWSQIRMKSLMLFKTKIHNIALDFFFIVKEVFHVRMKVLESPPLTEGIPLWSMFGGHLRSCPASWCISLCTSWFFSLSPCMHFFHSLVSHALGLECLSRSEKMFFLIYFFFPTLKMKFQ